MNSKKSNNKIKESPRMRMMFIRIVNDLKDNKKCARYALKSGHSITGYVTHVEDGIMSVESSGKLIANVDIAQIEAIEYP